MDLAACAIVYAELLVHHAARGISTDISGSTDMRKAIAIDATVLAVIVGVFQLSLMRILQEKHLIFIVQAVGFVLALLLLFLIF